MTRRKTSSPVDHDRRWRPKGRGPECGYTFRGRSCEKSGSHYCALRADRVVEFFAQLLVHTKGPHKRRPFILTAWQEHDIVRPLFGEVVWSREWKVYVRRFRVAYIVVARKNGKSELAAGMLLYLLAGDDEEAAEVFGAAKDTKQAGKVFEPALRMTQLSPELSSRLKHNKNSRRLIYERTASYYEIITADAEGELGHNPHGFNLDEVLSQPDASLWEAMTTATGARLQELLFATTTETNDAGSFGAGLIDEAERVQEDPRRAPHVFAFVRKLPSTDDGLERLRHLFPGHPDLPVSTDPFDERNWKWPNPGLGDFLSPAALRRDAIDAKSQPAKENSFRQFRVNQRVQQVTRWMPLHVWDGVGNVQPVDEQALVGRRCFGGLDLAATTDLAALAWVFPEGDGGVQVLWRFWTPEAMVPVLDQHLAGKASVWARQGLLTVTGGDAIDYEKIQADVEADAKRFDVVEMGYDPWGAEGVRQWIEAHGVTIWPVRQTFQGLSGPMKELMRLAQTGRLRHGGNPVARWNADSLEVKQDDSENIRPVKPARRHSGKRIDGIVALAMALSAMVRHQQEQESVYESRGLLVF